MIPYAFDIAVYQVSGSPAWMSSNTYDIVARAPASSSKEQLKLMVQALLIDRFKLRFHLERKELRVYALVLAKDGPKFRLEREQQEGDGRVGAGRGHLVGHMVSSSVFAQSLALYLDRPVLDKAGIQGFFNFQLDWTPDETQRRLGESPPAETPPAGQTVGPSLFTAIQEQLGLKLVTQRAPVEMFVIDHVEEVPTEN